MNHSKDEEEKFEQLKLISYIIDPQRAKSVFEQPITEVSEASQDWFMGEIKRNSNLSEEEIKAALKKDSDPDLTVIEKV